MQNLNIKNFDPVQAWLDNIAYSHSKSEGTEYEYRSRLDVFCNFIGCTPQQILEDYEGTRDRDFRRKYAQYLRALVSKLFRENYAPNSIINQVTVVRSFFKYNDLPLGHVPIAKRKIVYHNRDITKTEIVNVLVSSRPRDRAFFCMMAQGGFRPDTLSKLKIKHIEPELSKGIVPCRVVVPADISKGEFGAYYTFIGEESVEHLKKYLTIIRASAGLEPEDHIFTSHETDKPVNTKSMAGIFQRTIEKLKAKGLMTFEQKEVGKPRNVRLYNLRKWFRKQAGHAGIEYVDFWMGHKTNYKAPYIPASDVHYFSRDDVEFQRKLYAEKAMPYLRLETATPSETEQTIKDLRKELERVSSENRDLRNKLEKFGLVEDKVVQLERDLQEVKASRGEIGSRAILGVFLTTIGLDMKSGSKALQELVRKKAKELLDQVKKERGYKTDEEALQALLKQFTNGMLPG